MESLFFSHRLEANQKLQFMFTLHKLFLLCPLYLFFKTTLPSEAGSTLIKSACLFSHI